MIQNGPRRRLIRQLGGLCVLGSAILSASNTRADAPIEYNRDVRPILMDNCFACHGADSGSRKADLRLDRREVAIDAGAIAPSDPDNSELVARIEALDDPTILMPPPKSKKTLGAEQRAILRRWIAEGAKYQPHWSLIAPTRPVPPAVKNESWVRNPIDRFILAKLEADGLTPAPEADRRTLARRLSLDLTGLPPEPSVVETFVNDKAPDAYEQLVDRLLNAPTWGEHRGRYWLDAARYADTHGIHFDNYREMWSYRDWVINAFNKNMPFDRFTIEQLAGDLIPDRTLDTEIASGFNRCNITSNEGGLIPEEYLVLYDRDRTETAGQVWLGLTVGCAVCHDHKFDPISQKEFYSLAAFFNNTTQGAMDGNIKDTPPTVFVPGIDDRKRWDALQGELTANRKAAEDRKAAARPDFDGWLAAATPGSVAALIPSDGLRFRATLDRLDADPAAPKSRAEAADAGDFEKDRGFSYGAWIRLPKPMTGSVVARMDDQHEHRGWDLWIENDRVGAHFINKWPADALKVISNNPIKIGEWTHVFVSYDGTARPEAVKIFLNGQAQPTNAQANALKNTIRTTVPLKAGQRHTTAQLGEALIHDLRVYDRPLTPAQVAMLAGAGKASSLLAKAAGQRSEAETGALFDWWLAALDGPSRQIREQRSALEAEQSAIKARGTVAHVMHEKDQEAMAYVLFRGDYDKRRDPVKPATPAALPPMPDDLPRNRIGLAKWLLRPEQPLTARVTVNRYWQELFGTGIVRTTGDFGVTGEPPSHPELLDWMAVEFRESGWDIKQFFKLLVTSAAYRQSAATTPEKLQKDAENRLLSRGPRFRMDAEMIRDYALATSGLLASKLGGPSVRPYQPEGVWEAVAMIGSNTRDYRPDTGDALYRRSLYTFWKRAAPPASMDIFNAPSREVCTVRRERTDTPLQALVTLNDTQFIEAARHLAQHALKDAGPETDGRLALIAGRLLARPFRPEEVQIVRASLDDLLALYKAHPGDAAELVAVGASKADPTTDPPTLAAWTMLVNELMNLDEVLNK